MKIYGFKLQFVFALLSCLFSDEKKSFPTFRSLENKTGKRMTIFSPKCPFGAHALPFFEIKSSKKFFTCFEVGMFLRISKPLHLFENRKISAGMNCIA